MLKDNSLFLRLLAVLALLTGVLISIFFGKTLQNNAEDVWYTKATETAEKATDSCLSWLAIQQTQLRGIASVFVGPDLVTEDEFYDVLDLIEVADSLPFHSIAYASRETHSSSEKYIVRLSSDANTIFSPGADLAKNKQILSAIATANRFPGEVVMSHPFKDSHGNLMACLLIIVHEFDKADVVIATINVLDLLGDLKALHVPRGLYLRAIEMNAMADGVPQQADFFNSARLPLSQARDFSIRVDSGKTHLEYFWLFTPDFSGGPATGLGRLVQIAGSLFSLMLFCAVWFLLTENVRVRHKVKKRTAELSNASKRIKALSDASFEAIILSENHICIDLNNTAVKMFGYSKKEAIGSAATIIFSSDQLEIVKPKINSGNEKPYEVYATKKDGTIFPILIQGRTIDHFGKNIRITAMTDITDRKNAEVEKEKLSKQLQQAKKMESIGLMAGGVAHDLNNILSGIIGYPDLLLQTLPQDSKLTKPIKAIRASGLRAAAVVADLLTVARGVATIYEVHNIHELIQEYFDSPESDKVKFLHPEVSYQQQFTAAHPEICCSPVHVKKCIMNLVINAAEAIGTKGTIVVSTHSKKSDDIAGSKQKMKGDEYVVISIQDTGSGIADSDLEHIFEPFYTRKEMGKSGTGLGLAVVWNTMEDHGGKVTVKSSDAGTCFKLYFPVSQEELSLQSESTETEKSTTGNEHILVVDDDEQLRDIASQMLLSFGYTVHSVSSGELAINFVKETPVDLIVMDMLMNPGMNGYQTYKEILKLYPEQKAIIVSGFSESDDVTAAIRLGAGSFIKKPYSMEQLGRVVKETFNP